MDTMDRRDYLGFTASGLALALAGCSEENGEAENDTSSAEDYIELVEHHFEDSRLTGSGVYLYATVENVSDTEIRMVEITCELYIDNERVEDVTTRIHDLGSGVQQTVEITRSEAERPDEITNYNIIVGVGVDSTLADYEQTYDFEEFEIQR
jgi:uncharacterized protein YaaQ